MHQSNPDFSYYRRIGAKRREPTESWTGSTSDFLRFEWVGILSLPTRQRLLIKNQTIPIYQREQTPDGFIPKQISINGWLRKIDNARVATHEVAL